MAENNPTITTGNIASTTNAVEDAQPAGSNKSIFDSGNYVQQKYNELYHDVDLYLDNSGDFQNPKRYYINPAAVLSMYMSDTANDWVVDGYLTFMYLPEGLEFKNKTGQTSNTPVDGKIDAAIANGETLKSYMFRGDGFDLLRVMIMPKSKKKEGPQGVDGLDISHNDTKWMLSYLFSVYDVEDVNDIPELQGAAGSYMKCLKLKFHDVRYQMLLTTNLEYSTSLPKNKNLKPNFFSDLCPGQGVLYTGEIIRDVFNETLSNPAYGGCEEFKIDESENSQTWDRGKAELFYTSAAQYSAEDDINYVISHHVSQIDLLGGQEAKNQDLCLLHTERSKKFGFLEDISLTPLTKYFEKAGSDQPGELQKEHFFITAETEEKNPTHYHRAPIGGDNKNTDLKTTKYGQILSYSFVDMSPAINSNMFCSKPVYSVDIGSREFNIEFKGNDVISARRMIAQSYISKLFKEGDNPEELFLPTIHKNKKDLNIFPTFSLNGNNTAVRQRNGLHDLLYTGIFQNACICFKVLGLTFRESGTFIGIDKNSGCADNDYNNKLFGQWFVVKVDHVFEAGMYMNIIYAVKIHRYKAQETKFEGTITN